MEITLLVLVLMVVVVAVLLVVTAVGAWHLREVRRSGSTALVAELESRLEQMGTEAREREAQLRSEALREAIATLSEVNAQRLGAQQDQATQRLAATESMIGEKLTSVGSALVEHVTNLEQLVREIDKGRENKHTQLATQLSSTAKHLETLATTTGSLKEVLASPKRRGQWGERAADDILCAAGFVEGISYEKQKAIAGRGTIPDFTFPVPGGRALHMDVKFPIDSYARYIEAATEPEAETHAKSFLKDVRNRVKELGGRDYIDPERTVDVVLCFIPNESIFQFICERDRNLVDEALAQKVMLCSPSTLFAVLAIVRQGAEQFQLERTSDEILSLIGSFRNQYEKFGDAIDLVDKRLASTRKAFDEMSGTRRRALERPLDRIEDLRAQRGIDTAAGYDDEPVAPALRAVGDDAW
jgi:DNA recombination protein RmuC